MYRWGAMQRGIAIFRLYKGRCTERSSVSTYRSSFKDEGPPSGSFDHEREPGAMKTVFIILALIAGVFAAPQGNPNDITILKQEENNSIGVSGYHFSYEQSDGQKREETAELKNEGTDNEFLTIVGSFSFVAPDGHTYRVDYTADENGFHPTISLAAK